MTNALGRIPILGLKPQVEAGLFPAKAFLGELIPFGATVFREGHDAVGAELLLESPGGTLSRLRLSEQGAGSDFYGISQRLDELGVWKFQIRAFGDDFESWRHPAQIKIASGQDQQLMILEAKLLIERALGEKERSKQAIGKLEKLLAVLNNDSLSAKARFDAANDAAIRELFFLEPLRSLVTVSDKRLVLCERELAGKGSWYEFFPRSEGATQDSKGNWVSGNFKTATKRLAAVRGMGFDVLYLPPIHPIGKSFRKGPNNTLNAKDSDPGSPWAIGDSSGGHDAIHPDLGSEKDFLDFIKAANKLGLEIAMDLALQASPDHPWVISHPQWFSHRADGSIAYAENPPKKYQDIYPINFDNDPEGLYTEILRVLSKWISFGVKIFRVDNPHTKPTNFWQRLISEINGNHPDVIFLAEAFTRPAIMHTLAKIGFQQSYSYFTWRNSKSELHDYLIELAYHSDAFFRPNFWVSTPDILSSYLQQGPVAHKIRAAIAATSVPSWGMYAGYELYESVAREGVEEHIDSEKYQYKPRDFLAAEKAGKSLAPYIKKLNQIRKAHPALGQLRNIEFHHCDDENILVFSKSIAPQHNQGKSDTIIVVANLDPKSSHESTIYLEMWKLGLADADQFRVRDLISSQEFNWSKSNFVRLDPRIEPVHILEVIR